MTQKVRYSRLEHYGFGPNVMKKTKVCTNCGRISGTDAAFCPECGEKLSGETLFDGYKRRHAACPYCDAVLTRDARYCPNCGKETTLRKGV